MDLSEYERPASLRGLHGSPATHANFDHDHWIGQLQEMGIGLYKIMDDGSGSVLEFARKLRAKNIMPIVRMWEHLPNPITLSAKAQGTVRRYIEEGITRWFEVNNEPNLPHEWRTDEWRTGGRPESVVQNWLKDAEAVIEMGGYPAFPALAQCGLDPESSSIRWYSRAFQWMVSNAAADAREAFSRGAWIASHDATLNHCYRDDSGQWHFEYPYDPVCQADKPGTSIMDDDNSLIGHRVPVQMLKEHLGLMVPVISTEGGVFMPREGYLQWDDRYPPYDVHGHAERTVAMYRWLESNTPDYYFGMCPWLIASELMGHPPGPWSKDCWFWVGQNQPVVDAVKQMGPPKMGPRPEPVERARLISRWMTEEEAEEWLQHFGQTDAYRALFRKQPKGES
ncbi:MAG: hypothetical protein OEV76_07080 [Anaerolineae bacterium]|nr:hypothetical protein [Anaerolineae bacterium]